MHHALHHAPRGAARIDARQCCAQPQVKSDMCGSHRAVDGRQTGRISTPVHVSSTLARGPVNRLRICCASDHTEKLPPPPRTRQSCGARPRPAWAGKRCNGCGPHAIAPRAGGYPTTVSHSAPAGTLQSPWQPQSQSVSAIILCARQHERCIPHRRETHRRWPATNLSSAHRPYVSAAQPSTPVSGTTPSFTITRMLSPEPSQFSTVPLVSWSAQGRRGQERRTLELDVRAEGRELADNEALVLRDAVRRERAAGGERAQIERSKHCTRVSVAVRGRRDSGERTVEHNDLVCRIDVERVIKRERARVVRERRVCARVVPAHPSVTRPSLNIRAIVRTWRSASA
jgi:hypothetical protein